MAVVRPVSAEQVRKGLEFQETQLLLIGTTIFDWYCEPHRLAVGETVTVSGTLAEHYVPICMWRGWGPNPIDLIVNERVVETRDTDPGGKFTFKWVPAAVGTYRLKVRYPGDWMHNPCESPVEIITVITKEQKEKEEMQFWLLVGGAAVAAVAVVGGVVWYAEEARRRELMLKALRRCGELFELRKLRPSR